ncbi:MAG: hypothetical protein IKB16_00715 [Lentisphaeria bacterium]|nr:hypothetical protein [Lentisphaeria bacterium]
MSDRNFYFNLGMERKLDSWNITNTGAKQFLCLCDFQCDENGDYVILFPYTKLSHDQNNYDNFPVYRELIIDGISYSQVTDIETAYISFFFGLRVHLQSGTHKLEMKISYGKDNLADWLNIHLIKDLPPAPYTILNYHKSLSIPAEQLPQAVISDPDLTGYTPGCGTTTAPGRFGFSKGDGVLDCAMPALGIVDKLYVCGHPEYRKPFRWSYSTLPERAPLHGSYYPATEKIDQDTISINHLTVTWATQFNEKEYACSYSLGTPGILTESAENIMRLTGLEFAGNYQYVLFSGKNQDVEIISTDLLENGVTMHANFLLLFGSTEFPDIPLMITLDRTPEKINVKRNPRTNRLTELIFHGCSRMITATPTGMECYQTVTPDQPEVLADLVNRCRFWSHAFMAYPVKCEEYYKIEHETEQVHIIQKFAYRYLTDEWNTAPLELAPLPPASTLNGTTITTDDHDFHFPTKFGYLKGAYGNTSSYTLPFMPVNRKYPMRDAKDSSPEELLNSCMDDFFRFADQFPAEIQSYPFAGALMEPYAFASTMSLFMKEEHRNKLRQKAEQRLEWACAPDRKYTYPVIDWNYMVTKRPEDEQVKTLYQGDTLQRRYLWNWYQRTEPFTNTKFHVCYLNVGLFTSNTIKAGTPDEIANLKTPLIENDWGVGLTFYYAMLCALASGNINPIRENWELLKDVYKFFDSMHDWACMGTGYSDNAITWVEGANYGVFTGFIHMAKALGDTKEMERGIYLAAKQLGLRMAIVRSSIHYFCNVYHTAPWYITKSFREESNPGQQFQNVPKKYIKNRFRPEGIYNLTTEGIYPEIFEALRKFCPDDITDIMKQLRDIFLTEETFSDANSLSWAKLQQITCMLQDEALDPAVSKQQVLEDIAHAEQKDLLLKKWRGIHIFSRRLPEHYFKAQLLAWNNMKTHPVWLEFWNNVRLDDAVIRGETATVKFIITGNAPLLMFGCRKKPVKVLLNRAEIQYRMDRYGTGFTIKPEDSGTLELAF